MGAYRLSLAPSPRRALVEGPPRGLPLAVATAVTGFLTGALLDNPQKMGQPSPSVERRPTARMPLPAKAMRIGRVPGNDLVLPDLDVSRHHEQVTSTAPDLVVEGKPLTRDLAGYQFARRGAYRVVYRIDDAARVVHVVRIDHRSSLYHTRNIGAQA